MSFLGTKSRPTLKSSCSCLAPFREKSTSWSRTEAAAGRRERGRRRAHFVVRFSPRTRVASFASPLRGSCFGSWVAWALPARLPPTLDMSVTDDRIIADTLALISAGEPVSLLTGDTGVLMSAKTHCAPFVAIPEDGWLLPPEPDKQTKELVELRRRIETLERNGPLLGIQMLGPDGAEIDQASISVVEAAGADAAVEAGVAELQRRFPMQTEFHVKEPHAPPTSHSIFGSPVWVAPSDEALRRYVMERYPKWIEKVRAVLTRGIADWSEGSKFLAVRAILANTGARPAENVVVEIEAKGGLMLSPWDGVREPDALPKPPRPPKGYWRDPGHHASHKPIRPRGASSATSFVTASIRSPSRFGSMCRMSVIREGRLSIFAPARRTWLNP